MGRLIISTIILIFGIPFAIHIFFKIHAPCSFLEAEWTAGDILGYYGAILSFAGTVVLGVLALYQNHIIKEEADKRTEILERREYNMRMPKFSVGTLGSNGACTNLVITIKNISENIATEISIFDIKILSPEGDVYWQDKSNRSLAAMPAGAEMKLQLNNPELKKSGYIFSFHLKCKDKFEGEHLYLVSGVYKAEYSFPIFKINEA